MATKGKIRFIRSYARNVGTSLKNYIIPSALLGVNPELKSFYDENKSFAGELRDQAKDLKDTVREQIRTFIKEDNLAKQTWRNAKKGLKTGKWHDFAASKAAQDEAMKSMMGDMGFDFNLEDEDASFKDEFDKESMDVGFMEDIADKLGVSQQSSALMSADMIGGTISKTSAQSMLHITQMTNVLTTSLNAINSSIVKLHSDFVNPINDHLKNFTKFSDSTTNELQKQTQYLKQISEALTEQFKDRDPKKKETRDYWADVFGTDGLKLPNFRRWWEIGLEKAKDDNPLTFINPAQLKGFLGQMAASPVSFAVTSYLQNQMQRGFIGKSFKNMSNLARVAADKLSDYVRSKAGGDGILDSLIGLFDIKKSRAQTTSLDYSAYNKEIARWTGRDSRALQTVIPTQLSQIISLLSGQPPKMFDYEAGTWKTTRQIQKEFESKVITNMTDAIDKNLLSRFTEEVGNIKDFNTRSKYEDTLKEFLLLSAGNSKSNFSKYKTKEDYMKSDAYKQIIQNNDRLDKEFLNRLLDRAYADRSNEAIPNLAYLMDSSIQNIRNQHDRFVANISTDRGSRAYIDSKNGANLNTTVSSINTLLNQQGSHNVRLFDYLDDILETLTLNTSVLQYINKYQLNGDIQIRDKQDDIISQIMRLNLGMNKSRISPKYSNFNTIPNITSNTSNDTNQLTTQTSIHPDDTSISGLNIFDILKRGNHELKYSANNDIKWSSDVDEEFKKSVNEATNRAIEDDKARANPFYQIYKGFEVALSNVITGKTYDSYDQLQKERRSSKDATIKKGLVGVLQDLPKALNETVAKPIIDQTKLGWKGIQGSGFLGKIASSIVGDAETVKDKALEYLKELGFTGDALEEQMRNRGLDPDDTGSTPTKSTDIDTNIQDNISNNSNIKRINRSKSSLLINQILQLLPNKKLRQYHMVKLHQLFNNKTNVTSNDILNLIQQFGIKPSQLPDSPYFKISKILRTQWDDSNNGKLAKGGIITKSGMASVSEGEIVIPAKYNPFYNNRLTDKQRDDIEQANFEKWLQSGAPGGQYFGKYKDGGVVSTDTAAKAAPVPNDPENKDYFGEAAHGIVNSISKKIESGIDLLFGDDSKESTKYKKKNVEITDLVQENLPKYIGRTALGGLLGHIVLSSPYGLLGGLVAGAGISLYRDYKEASNKVFGKQEEGKENKSKWLSWLPQKAQKFISGSLPNVTKAGLLGAGLGLLSPLGLFGGMVTAAGLELVFGTKRIREFLFGDPKNKNKKGAIPTIKEFLFGSKDKKKPSFFAELKKNWIDPVPLFFRNISDMASSKFDALGLEIKKFGRSLKYGIIEPAKRFFQYDWAKTKYDVIDPTKRFLQLDWIKTKQHMKSMKDKAVGWLQDRKWGRFLINDAKRTYEDFKSAKEKTKAFVKKSGKNILKGTAVGAGVLGLGGLAVTGAWMPAAIAAGVGGIAGMRHLNPYLRDRNILKGRSSLSAEERFAAYNRMEMGDSFKKLSEENQQAVLQQLAIAQNLNVSPDDRQKAYDAIKTILETAYEQKELKQKDFEALNNNLSQLQLGKSNIDTVANDVNATKQRTIAHRYTRAIVSGKANADDLSKLFSSMSHVRNQDKYNTAFEEFKNKFNNLNIKHVGNFDRTTFDQISKQIQEAVSSQSSNRLTEIRTKQIKNLPISGKEKSDLISSIFKIAKEYHGDNKAISGSLDLAKNILGQDVDFNSLKYLILNPQMSSDIKRLKKQADSNSSTKLIPEIKQNAPTTTPSVSQQNRALKADKMEHPVQNEILGNTGKLVQLVGQIVDQQSSNTSKTKNNKGSRKNKSKKDNAPEEIKEEPQQDSNILPTPDIQQEQEEQQAPNQAEPENQPPKDTKKFIMSSIHTANDITETLNYASRGLFGQLPLFKMINWASKAGKMFGMAKGGKVKKSGLASVSEGEMIVPNLSDYAAKTTPFDKAFENSTPKEGEKKVELVNGIPTEYIYRNGEWNINTTDSETKRSAETQDIRNEFYRKMVESDFFELIKNLKNKGDADQKDIEKAQKDADSLLGGLGGGGLASKLKSVITNPYVLGGAATLLAGLVFYKNGQMSAGGKYDPKMRRGMNPETRKQEAKEAGIISNILDGMDATANKLAGKDMTTYGSEDHVSDSFTQHIGQTLKKMGLRGLAASGVAGGAGRGLAGIAADAATFTSRGGVINSLWKASEKLPRWARVLSRATLAPFKAVTGASNMISRSAYSVVKATEGFDQVLAKASKFSSKAAKMAKGGMIRTTANYESRLLGNMIKSPVQSLLARLQNIFNGAFAKIIKYFPRLAITSGSIEKASKAVSTKIAEFLLKHQAIKGVAQQAAKAIPVVGQAAIIIFTGNAVLENMLDGRAKITLGILDPPTVWQKIVASTIAGLNEFFLFGIIPAQYLVDIVMWGLSLLGIQPTEFYEQRKHAEQVLAQYNSENGTTYNLEEYVVNVLGENTSLGQWGAKAWDKTQSIFTGKRQLEAQHDEQVDKLSKEDRFATNIAKREKLNQLNKQREQQGLPQIYSIAEYDKITANSQDLQQTGSGSGLLDTIRGWFSKEGQSRTESVEALTKVKIGADKGEAVETAADLASNAFLSDDDVYKSLHKIVKPLVDIIKVATGKNIKADGLTKIIIEKTGDILNSLNKNQKTVVLNFLKKSNKNWHGLIKTLETSSKWGASANVLKCFGSTLKIVGLKDLLPNVMNATVPKNTKVILGIVTEPTALERFAAGFIILLHELIPFMTIVFSQKDFATIIIETWNILAAVKIKASTMNPYDIFNMSLIEKRRKSEKIVKKASKTDNRIQDLDTYLQIRHKEQKDIDFGTYWGEATAPDPQDVLNSDAKKSGGASGISNNDDELIATFDGVSKFFNKLGNDIPDMTKMISDFWRSSDPKINQNANDKRTINKYISKKKSPTDSFGNSIVSAVGGVLRIMNNVIRPFRSLADISSSYINKIADKVPNIGIIGGIKRTASNAWNWLKDKFTGSDSNDEISESSDEVTEETGSGTIHQTQLGNYTPFGNSTIDKIGCGPAALATIRNLLGDRTNTTNVAREMGGGITKNGATVGAIAQNLKNRTGRPSQIVKGKQDIASLAKRQKPIIALGKNSSNRHKSNSPFGPRNHYVAIRGMKNGKVIVDDPEQNRTVAYNKRILNDINVGIAAGQSGIENANTENKEKPKVEDKQATATETKSTATLPASETDQTAKSNSLLDSFDGTNISDLISKGFSIGAKALVDKLDPQTAKFVKLIFGSVFGNEESNKTDGSSSESGGIGNIDAENATNENGEIFPIVTSRADLDKDKEAYSKILNTWPGNAYHPQYPDPSFSSLANCVGWANARFNYVYCKLKGLKPYVAYSFYQNPPSWIERVKNKKYGPNDIIKNPTSLPDLVYSKEPQVGALICWRSSGESGHVAFVEKVSDDRNTIWVSESSYSGWWDGSDPLSLHFTDIHRNNGQWKYSDRYTFLGFILNPAVAEVSKAGGFEGSNKKSISGQSYEYALWKFILNNVIMELFKKFKLKVSDTKIQDGAKRWTAAIMGNFMAESGLISSRHQNGGNGYGLAQWDDRRKSLESWAATNKLPVDNWKTQAQFMNYELHSTEAETATYIVHHPILPVKNATMEFHNRYERSADTRVYPNGSYTVLNQSQVNKRITSAEQFYNKYKNGAPNAKPLPKSTKPGAQPIDNNATINRNETKPEPSPSHYTNLLKKYYWMTGVMNPSKSKLAEFDNTVIKSNSWKPTYMRQTLGYYYKKNKSTGGSIGTAMDLLGEKVKKDYNNAFKNAQAAIPITNPNDYMLDRKDIYDRYGSDDKLPIFSRSELSIGGTQPTLEEPQPAYTSSKDPIVPTTAISSTTGSGSGLIQKIGDISNKIFNTPKPSSQLTSSVSPNKARVSPSAFQPNRAIQSPSIANIDYNKMLEYLKIIADNTQFNQAIPKLVEILGSTLGVMSNMNKTNTEMAAANGISTALANKANSYSKEINSIQKDIAILAQKMLQTAQSI